MAGGNVWEGLWKGALFGGVAGAAGGYLQHVAFENSLFDTDLMQANKQRKTYFGGTLDEVVVRGRPLPPLSNGAIKPNYFFEDLFVGGAIFKPIGAMFGVLFGRFARGGANLSDDMIRVRHHTSPEALKGIRNSNSIFASRGKPYGVDVEVYPFLKPSQVNLGQAGRGAYVEFTISKTQLSSLPGGYMGGVGTPARIITGGSPLIIKNAAPRFVRWNWWPW